MMMSMTWEMDEYHDDVNDLEMDEYHDDVCRLQSTNKYIFSGGSRPEGSKRNLKFQSAHGGIFCCV
jgi:hypothetical protein